MSTYLNYLKQHKRFDRNRQTTKGDFTMKDQRMYMCINKMQLTGTQYKVMEFIIRHTHGDCNKRHKPDLLATKFSQQECADELCIRKYQVNQAIPALAELNIITILHRDSIGTEVQLNTALDTWRSSAVQEYISNWIMTDTEKRLQKASKSSKAAAKTAKREVLVSAATEAAKAEVIEIDNLDDLEDTQLERDKALLAELEGM
jgi:hypothetical protein